MGRLVLTRRPNERIVIGGNIVVEVVRIKGQRVRLGIQAPAETPIDRGEVDERKRKEHGNEQG